MSLTVVAGVPKEPMIKQCQSLVNSYNAAAQQASDLANSTSRRPLRANRSASPKLSSFTQCDLLSSGRRGASGDAVTRRPLGFRREPWSRRMERGRTGLLLARRRC